MQPWHPQGSYVHEAALAVKHLAPDKYLAFCSALYKAFDEGKFKDADTWDKSRSQIYADLVALAESVGAAGIDKCLAMNAESQECNQMTQHLKWAVKYHRCRGVHVTPTVHVNGLEAGVVSSGWTAEQWVAFLQPQGADNWTGSNM